MDFLFGGGGGGPSEEERKRQESREQKTEERVQKQEEKVERQERQEKAKITARKTAVRQGATGAGTMTQLVSQGRTDPMRGNPRMPDEQTKLGRNPR